MAADYVLEDDFMEIEKAKNKTALQKIELENKSLTDQLVTIKNNYNEKIKIVNRYTVLDLQHYFDERYGSK